MVHEFETESFRYVATKLRGVNDMYGQLTLLVIAAGVTSTKVIAIAGIVVAVVVVIGGVLVIRSGKNKGAKTSGSAGQTDWQRQSQIGGGGAGNWNQQPMGNMGGMNNDASSWAQQGQQGQQGGWNNQPMAQQAGQNAWGGGQDVQSQSPAWAQQGNQAQSGPAWAQQGNPNQTQQPAWVQNAQQSSSPSWAAQNNPAPQQAANSWNNPGFQAAPNAQSAQDSWGMQQQGATQNQGMQQPQTAFGNASSSSWNQSGFGGTQSASNGPNDAWSMGASQPQSQYAPQSANNGMGGFSSTPVNNAAQAPQAAQAPAWAQQGNYGQAAGGMGASGGWQGQQADNTVMSPADNDRTIIRPSGSGLGFVRVEEGKEPGREYDIRKESLSIGRSRESDIFLEDLAVSRLHASIVNQGNGNYALKDEGSANGTKINGQLVGKYQTYPLQDGDRIQLGQTVLVFGHR